MPGQTSKPEKKRDKTAKPPAIEGDYVPTDRECEAVKASLARSRNRPPAPSLKVTREGHVFMLDNDHADPRLGFRLLMESLGTADGDFLDGLLGQLVKTVEDGGATCEKDVNFMLSVIKGIEPRDQMEALLAAQMAAVHAQAMAAARRLNRAELLPQLDSAEKALNKLTRTFASQMEALRKYRNGGEQTVRVEHVTVNEGGQAIVGNVAQDREGGRSRK